MATLRRYVSRSPSQLLTHILERPELVSAIRELPAPTLSRLVERIGVEDCADLIALASTEQLAALLDEDLFRADESQFEERFDPRRFALWLQVFAEAGEDFLVRRLCELPVDLLALAVHRLVLVIDADALRSFYHGARDELGEIERALEDAVAEDWEEFCLIARDLDAWEDVWNALLLLDREHHERLRTILEQCSAMSLEYIDGQGGLYEVLTSDEMLESDALAARDDRRAAHGYVSRSDARAFLELAADGRQPLAQRDAIAIAYFRALPSSSARNPAALAPRRLPASQAVTGVDALMQLVAELDAEAARPRTAGRLGKRATPSSRDAKESSRAAHAEQRARPRQDLLSQLEVEVRIDGSSDRRLLEALEALSRAEPALHGARMDELGFLANVLLSGCTHQGRNLRPVEALEAALATSNLGLELWQRSQPGRAPDEDLQLVREVSCDRLFRLAWSVLQRDIVATARQLLERRSTPADARRAGQARDRSDDSGPCGARDLHTARELELDQGSPRFLHALAEKLPWRGEPEEKRGASPWISSRISLERARRRLTALDSQERRRSGL